MADGRSALIWVGAAMMAASAILPVVLFASSEGFGDVLGALIFTAIFSPLLFIVGLILLIVGIVRGRRTHQQQQQQVIVVTGEEARRQGILPGGRNCVQCGAPLGAGLKYCTQCGTRVPNA